MERTRVFEVEDPIPADEETAKYIRAYYSEVGLSPRIGKEGNTLFVEREDKS